MIGEVWMFWLIKM